MSATKPKVLFVYYTYTNQTKKVVDAMSEVMRERDCEVELAPIVLTDKRYTKRFNEFPMPHAFREVLSMIPTEIFRKTGEIAIPDEAKSGDYDLVVIGSPTWWLSTNLPIRSYLDSEAAAGVLNEASFAPVVCCRRYYGHNLRTVKKLAAQRGGKYVDGIHFAYQGGQIKSLLSLISYLGSGEYKDRFLGVKIPPTNLQDDQLGTAREFANGLADNLNVGDATPTP
jgi:menaquinone-dependent protoporphyrinogen IX oxidase